MNRFIMTVLVLASFTLIAAACGSSSNSSGSNSSSTPSSTSSSSSTPSSTSSSSKTSVADGAKSMQATLADLQKQLDAKDQSKVKEDAKKLEDSWVSFEDEVKTKTPDLYGKVETPLGIIQAGSGATPLDTATLSAAVKELNTVLTELAK
jgi:iron uptake system EfeUOB component EfeO/EfeM